MATRNIVPRANNEGNIGTHDKQWLGGHFRNLWVDGQEIGNIAVGNVWTRQADYSVGELAYTGNLPNNQRLECVVAGTTGFTEPTLGTVGQYVIDGTALFIIDDIRDGTPIGQVRASTFVPAGYVKAEGATVVRANYPRLVTLADTYSLWTSDPTANPGLFGEGDGSTTMTLPNWAGRMAQFSALGDGSAIAAGLPNIQGRVTTGFFQKTWTTLNSAFEYTVWNANLYTTWQANANSDFGGIILNAAKYDSIYGSSTTVQPPAINVFAIMRY